MHIVGNHIKLARMKLGLSLRELGNKAGVTASCVMALEKGISLPRPQTAKKLCEALGCEFDELFIVEEAKKEAK